jgi:hypothetical protein
MFDIQSLLLNDPQVLPRPLIPVVDLITFSSVKTFVQKKSSPDFYMTQMTILDYGQPEAFGTLDALIDTLPMTSDGQRALAYLLLQAIECSLRHTPQYDEYHSIPRLHLDALMDFVTYVPRSGRLVLDPEIDVLIHMIRAYNTYLWQFVEFHLTQLPLNRYGRVRLLTSLYLLVGRQQFLNAWQKKLQTAE